MRGFVFLGLLLLSATPSLAADTGLAAVTSTTSDAGVTTYSLSIKVLLLMTALTLLPTAVLMTTSFTRIVIVLAILRQALGTAQTPSNQILIGLSLFLSFFVMYPVFSESYQNGISPYLEGNLGDEVAIERTIKPIRTFMMNQTRESDIAMFASIADKKEFDSPDDVPMSVLIPSFVTSELKTAFQIGFLIFIPFLVLDLLVSSVLMSMGMMMLSPMLISLPFKLMLFVLIDGWSLIMGTLAGSFYK